MTNLKIFDPSKFVEEAIFNIREIVKNDKAVIAVSGGVDSTVAAILVSKAIGNNLEAIFIDTGLMRKYENEEVTEMLKSLNINFLSLSEIDTFLNALKGIADPEQKRKVIGETFIRIFEREAEKFGAHYLVQGTIAPDWIESGDELRETIKSHHNVGGIPKNIKLRILEPLRDLYKDEVRELARYLGLTVSERQPFPGPGLAIRVMGEITSEKLEIARDANYIFEREIYNAVKDSKIQKPWQFFAVLLSTRSVGVHGDKRAFGYTVALRAIESMDGMSGTFSRIPFDLLDDISIKITNSIKGVNRVVYDITNKPPATIEWE
ncbi:MAG: glutamine-hydrolyzing GMP synthase [Thermoplasmata archaeon]